MSERVWYIFFIINLGGLGMKKYIVTLAEDEREALFEGQISLAPQLY